MAHLDHCSRDSTKTSYFVMLPRKKKNVTCTLSSEASSSKSSDVSTTRSVVTTVPGITVEPLKVKQDHCQSKGWGRNIDQGNRKKMEDPNERVEREVNTGEKRFKRTMSENP